MMATDAHSVHNMWVHRTFFRKRLAFRRGIKQDLQGMLTMALLQQLDGQPCDVPVSKLKRFFSVLMQSQETKMDSNLLVNSFVRETVKEIDAYA